MTDFARPPVAGWKPTTLGELCEVDPEILNESVSRSYRFRYIDISSVSPHRIAENLQELSLGQAPSRARKRVRRDDVLMATVRPNLKAFARVTAAGELVASTGFAVLRARAGVSDPRFIEQLLFCPGIEAQIEGLVAGSNYPAISVSNVRRLKLFAPDLRSQRRMAELLSSLDEQTQVSEQRVHKLLGVREALVQAQLMPAAEACSPATLGALCSVVTSGSRGWASYYADRGALFLRIGNLTREHPNLRYDDVVRVQVPHGGEGARTRLKEGDVLISITADLGIIGCVPPGLGEAFINQHIALARVSDPRANPRWVAHALASPFGQRQISRLNDGGAKAGLNLPTISALSIALPSLATQVRVATALDELDAQIAAERALVRKLLLKKRGLMADLLEPEREQLPNGSSEGETCRGASPAATAM